MAGWGRRLLVALACCAACTCTRTGAAFAAAAHAPHAEERLIGWNGETYRGGGGGGGGDSEEQPRRWVEVISWAPRALLFHNFLARREVDHLVSLVEREVTRSHVVDTTTGEVKLDPIRTSWGAPLMRGQTPIVAAIEDRIAEWTRLPPDHGEPMQVLRYEDGQEYRAHFDWFENPKNTHGEGENRAATVLMYLADVEDGAGGETSLPLAKPLDAARQKLAAPSECAQRGEGLAVVPKRGDALLFWDMHPDGRTVDRMSLHASCPTTKGVKYTATKWLHNRPVGRGYRPVELAGACDDADAGDDCAAAAAAGKCDSARDAMLGVGGRCRRSCGDCVACARGDLLCLRRNMRSLRAELLAAAAAANATQAVAQQQPPAARDQASAASPLTTTQQR